MTIPKRRRRANSKPAKGFTRRFHHGPPGHKEAVRNARKAEEIATRRRKAWKLFLEDATFDEIGKACGVSNYTAWHDCMAYYEGLQQRDLDQAELLLAQQNGQLAALVRTHWYKKHEKASADVILRALERRARLYGLDRQRADTFTPEQVLNLLRGVTALFLEIVSDTELRRQFAAGLRRKIGPALAFDVRPTTGDAENAETRQSALA